MKIYDEDSGELVGELTADQLQFLRDHLEEESLSDQDYFINEDTIALLSEAGATPELVALLQTAISKKGEIEMRFTS